jgi:hypothetical protein
MHKTDIDALVTVVREAIDQRTAYIRQKFESDLSKSAQELRDQSEEIARLKAIIEETPKPKDGQDGQSATPEIVLEAVEKYMQANPVPTPKAPEALAPTEEQLGAAVAKHFSGFELKLPDPLPPTPEMVQEAVAKHMQANPVPIPKAPEALAPTDDQLARVVAKHLADNPPVPGARGLDALEITILPSINTERRYAKGTYARWGGGVIRALRDTEPGDPIFTGCWDVVIDGVKAIEVHPLGGAEFAVKSILTGGASHIAKLASPTFTDSYKDVWKESAGEYKRGDIVTHKGSVWLAKSDTAERPGTGDGWRLIVKAGRDGKDLSLVKLDRPATYKLEP